MDDDAVIISVSKAKEDSRLSKTSITDLKRQVRWWQSVSEEDKEYRKKACGKLEGYVLVFVHLSLWSDIRKSKESGAEECLRVTPGNDT